MNMLFIGWLFIPLFFISALPYIRLIIMLDHYVAYGRVVEKYA